ncbi:MAG: hypothetical protein EOO88_50165 [Pedobacter sp.]|nr:MAG: hypothetical protein EOO88_50165 [Pedobacter sp.]
MRNLVLAAGILCVGSANAQLPNKFYKLMKSKTLQKQITYQKPQLFKLPDGAPVTLPNGNSVFILPQDNMPCVVPSGYSNMPNAYVAPQDNSGQAGKIPNPAPPLQTLKPLIH